jgi:LmbE family N-acetylglucosaminyl deacetylase
MDLVTCERAIRGDGTPAGVWSAWLNDLAPLSLEPLLQRNSASRLVVVAPHPDDEILACAGLLMTHGRDMSDSLVIAVTDGEASHPAIIDPVQLAEVRRQESQAGLHQLGAGAAETIRLQLPDGGVGARVRELTGLLTRELRTGDVVVTTWRWDGHPDHEATGLAAARACASAGCMLLESPVWMWHWASPGDARVPWHRLRRLALGRDEVAAKLAALAEHQSQLTRRSDALDAVLGPDIRARAAWPCEYFLC